MKYVFAALLAGAFSASAFAQGMALPRRRAYKPS
jgi:hypothetical protein